jgi:hypothetical protein
MLEDTAKTAVVEVEGQVAELCAAAAENEKVADNLERAARVLGAKVPPRLTPKTGARSSSTFDLGRNEKSIILQTATERIVKIVEMAAPNGDVDGLGKLLRESGKLAAILGAPAKEDSRLAELCSNIIRAYQVGEYHA